MSLTRFIIGAAVAAVACVGAQSAAATEKHQGDTVTVSGKYIDRPMKVTVVTPESYLQEADTTRYPVLYLLNGHGGDYRNWSRIVSLVRYCRRVRVHNSLPFGIQQLVLGFA